MSGWSLSVWWCWWQSELGEWKWCTLWSLFRNHHQSVKMICKTPLLHLLSCAVKLTQRPSMNANNVGIYSTCSLFIYDFSIGTLILVQRHRRFCGSIPSPKCLCWFEKGRYRPKFFWDLGPCTYSEIWDILGTENFHRMSPAEGLYGKCPGSFVEKGRPFPVKLICKLFDLLCYVLIQHGLQIGSNDHYKSRNWIARQMFKITIGMTSQ